MLTEVINRLNSSDRRVNKSFTTTDIDSVIRAVLGDPEEDFVHAAALRDVLDAWLHHGHGIGSAQATELTLVDPRRNILQASHVPVSCGKSHSTIWGNAVKSLEEIPSDQARRVLEHITSVPGITRITLGQFGHKGSRRACQASVAESKTPHVIEGKLYDKGRKGTMQSFQVWVQSDEAKPQVAAAIKRVLRREGSWAG